MAKKMMNERQFNGLIYKLVKESIDTLMQSSPFEGDNSSDNNSEEGETEKERKIRMSVEKQLQKPGIDIAPYAYKLDDIPIQPSNGDDNEHKNARSKLYKKLNHKPDSNGEPQYLSPEEAIELKNELSSNLSESRKLRLTESDLTYLVTEATNRILKEAYSDAQYAHLAGQAQGALDSFGGKIKGFFNPKWKARKQRQVDKFSRQSTGQNFGYDKSSTNGGDNNLGRSTYHQTSYNDPEANYFSNDFRPDSDSENPYQITRHHFLTPHDATGRPMFYDDDRTTYTGKQYMDKTYYDADRSGDLDTIDRRDNVSYGNRQLNRAFNQGRNARKGGTYGQKTNGTGTGSEVFKGLK